MKNRTAYMNSATPSSFWVSRDYGKTFNNISKKLTLPNGTRAVITEFYSSNADHENYILVDKFHKYIFSSNDECRTFKRVSVSFHPVEIKYHPKYRNYVLAYEKDMGNKQVLHFCFLLLLLLIIWLSLLQNLKMISSIYIIL